VTLGTLGINFIFPRFLGRVPAPLVAVVIPTAVVYAFGIKIPTIGEISYSIPSPQLPRLPKLDLEDLLTTTLTVYIIASIETLLASSTAERISKTSRTDPDQEMIGQGLGNMVTSLFGGFPATGVIARTSLNIQSGAKTRRAGIFQSLLILIAVSTCGPMISKIPIAALTGITISIALRMLHPREFFKLWKIAPQEATFYGITFFIIITADAIAGIRVGILSVLIIALIRNSQSKTKWNLFSQHSSRAQRFQELKIDGPLTFQSTVKIEEVREQLSKIQPSQGLVVNLSKVSTIDLTGATQLIEALGPIIQRKQKIVLFGLNSDCRKTLLSADTHQTITKYLATSESEMMELLYDRSPSGPINRLIYGVEKFKNEMQAGYGSLFKNLADGQNPHTLFITCSDSRIDPNLITSTHPGELFIVRNVGNLIPRYGVDQNPAEGAAVEFAVGVLNVKEVIVCGHSGCGAMKEVLQGTLSKSSRSQEFPSLKAWLEQAQGIKDQLPPEATIKQAAERNAVLQVENLKTYPLIQERLKTGKLRIHSWYYNIGDSELEEWDEKKQLFVTIGSRESKSQTHRIEAGVQYQVPVIPEEDPS
jgi:carbonic anhydrase